MAIDEKTAAQLLWQIKVIATKEFESLPLSSKERLFEGDEHSLSSEDTEEEYQVSNRRWRAVSIESIDVAKVPVSSPVPSSKSVAIIDPSYADSPSSSTVEHHDWSKRKSSSLHSLAAPSLISTPPALITQKYGKRKRESFVGLTTQSGVVRGTLRKKFSWKQYPEVRIRGAHTCHSSRTRDTHRFVNFFFFPCHSWKSTSSPIKTSTSSSLLGTILRNSAGITTG